MQADYNRKTDNPDYAKNLDQAKAESALMNLLEHSFLDLLYFYEYNLNSVANAATIRDVLKAYEAEIEG